MSLYRVFFACLALILSAGVYANDAKVYGKPNIILFLVDDLRWDEIGYAGAPTPTPNIDHLANEGIRFDNAFVTSSLCSPSRASFLTGMYPHSHGVVGNNTDLDITRTPTIGNLLKKEGYTTALVGKWHMGRNAEPRVGFDYWMALPGQGRYFDPLFNENGKEVSIEGYSTDVLTDKALEFIDKNKRFPFYLHLSYKAVHAQFEAAMRHQDQLEREQFVGWERPNAAQRSVKVRKKRAETLLSVDESIGRVYEYLETNNMLENTVLVFTSDNGFLLREHSRGDKRVFYEESIRIPMAIHYPKRFAGKSSVNKHVLNIDFLPSMLELAGAEIPEHIQGRSFVPLLDNPKAGNIEWRDHWLYEYFNEFEFPHLPTHLAIVSERYKFVRFPEGTGLFKSFTGEDLLFDLQDDPYELDNIAQSDEHQGTVRKMNQQMLAYTTSPDFSFYPLDPERINKRIKQLYLSKQARWFAKKMDKVFPEGYPGWEAPDPSAFKRPWVSPPPVDVVSIAPELSAPAVEKSRIPLTLLWFLAAYCAAAVAVRLLSMQRETPTLLERLFLRNLLGTGFVWIFVLFMVLVSAVCVSQGALNHLSDGVAVGILLSSCLGLLGVKFAATRDTQA